MFGVGRDLCGSSKPTPPPKQGHLQQAAQDLVQAGLEYLQRGRLHNLPGQPVPVLCHPQREEVLPHVQMELPVLQFVPIAPCPVAGHHWKEFDLRASLLQSYNTGKRPIQSPHLTKEEKTVAEQYVVSNRELFPIHLVVVLFRSIWCQPVFFSEIFCMKKSKKTQTKQTNKKKT